MSGRESPFDTKINRHASSAVVAVLFALFVNQGVIYYIQRFSVSIDVLSPWPVLLAVMAATIIAICSTTIDEKFVRVGLASFVVCLLLAATYAWSPSGQYGLDKTLLTLFVPTLCIAAGFVVARDGHLQLFLASCATLAGLTAIVFTANGHTPAMFSEGERARSVIITYHNFAFIMALGAIWAINRFAQRLATVHALYLTCLLIFVYFILLSGGRIGLLLVFLTGMIFLWTRVTDRFLAMALIGACLLIVGIISLLLQSYALEIANSEQAPATLKRLVHYAFLQREGKVAAGTRDIFYDLALDVFSRSPLVGVGWGGFPVSAALTDISGNWPHNLVLELLAETGVIGTMIFFAFLGMVLYSFMRDRGEPDDKNVTLVIFLVGFAASMVGGDWPSQRLLFFSIGAMTGVSVKSSSAISRNIRSRPVRAPAFRRAAV